MTYVKGEQVEVWSTSSRLWIDATVAEVYVTDCFANGYSIVKGSLRVVYADERFKYISPDRVATTIRKKGGGGDPISGNMCKWNCGFRVQPGLTKGGNRFDTCCRTCAESSGEGMHQAHLHDENCAARSGPFDREATKVAEQSAVSEEELVRKARSVMESMQEPPDIGVPKYMQPESILEILRRETEPVKLLRRTWVAKYAAREGQIRGLPRRQDLEQTVATDAFLPHAEVAAYKPVRTIYSLNIFSISYCWRAWDHPDADGMQLRAIETKLQTHMAEDSWQQSKFKDAGIFWDFGSLYQKDNSGMRTETEKARFEEALETMDIWYMHALIMTFIVNGGLTSVLGIRYEDRGWTHFERSCAELLKPARAGGFFDGQQMVTEFAATGRKLPLSPELFAVQMAKMRFTHRGDMEMVVSLYTKACMLALRGTQKLSLHGIKLQRHDCQQVVSVLQQCCSLTWLGLSEMDIIDQDFLTIFAALRCFTSLRRFFLQGNNINDAGAIAIAEALPRMSSLETLSIDDNNITQVGKDALQQAWASTAKPELKIDDAGAMLGLIL